MRAVAVVFVVVIVPACTGEFLGERAPGDDTFLGPDQFHDNGDGTASALGSIGVDPVTQRSFVARAVRDLGDSNDDGVTQTSTALFSVPRESDAGVGRRDVSGRDDLRILFPAGDVLLMGESDGVDHLERLDPATLAVTDVIDTDARYHGTRLSPSRQFLAVADVSKTPSPIHVIDVDTHEIEEVPHDADWLEAMWAHNSDTLYAVLFFNDDDKTPADEAHARIVGWSFPDVQASGFAKDPDGLWSRKTVDVDLPGVSADGLFSFTWVGVSPDDKTVAIPLLAHKDKAWEHVVVLVDTETGAVRSVEDAAGPVGFTPDGTTVVSYRYAVERPRSFAASPKAKAAAARLPGREVTQLVLIDVEDLTTATIDVPSISFPSYFCSRAGNLVVVADALDGGKLVLADVDHGTAHTMSGPDVSFEELVERGAELWVTDEGLFRVDLLSSSVEKIDTGGFAPEHINLVAGADGDRLVMDDGFGTSLLFVDPAAETVTARVSLQ